MHGLRSGLLIAGYPKPMGRAVRRLPHFVLTGFLGVALSACAGNGPPSFVSGRDSAGVTIVESTSPRWGAAEGWTFDPEPLLDLTLSGTGEPHEFYRVVGAIRLDDGSIAVADAGSSEVRFFAPTGTFLSSVGREGEGPGEFQRLTSVHRFRGDSLAVFDHWARRVTVISPDWEASRVISLQLPFLWKLRPLGDSRLLTMLSWPSVLVEEGEAGLVRMPVPVVRFSLSGEVIDTVAMAAGSEEVRIATEHGFASARPLFGKNSHLVVHQGRFYLGSADQMEYRIFAPDGKLGRIVRVTDYDLALSHDELQAERNAILGENPSARRRRHVDALPVPRTKPAYSELLVDTEGCVWAAEHIGEMRGFLGIEPKKWEVFSADGEWLGSVRSPPRFTMFEIGTDYVLGNFRDDLDVEHVQVLRLVR
jgi:hypothetical protein